MDLFPPDPLVTQPSTDLQAERQGHHGCREGRVGGLCEPRDDARWRRWRSPWAAPTGEYGEVISMVWRWYG